MENIVKENLFIIFTTILTLSIITLNEFYHYYIYFNGIFNIESLIYITMNFVSTIIINNIIHGRLNNKMLYIDILIQILSYIIYMDQTVDTKIIIVLKRLNILIFILIIFVCILLSFYIKYINDDISKQIQQILTYAKSWIGGNNEDVVMEDLFIITKNLTLFNIIQFKYIIVISIYLLYIINTNDYKLFINISMILLQYLVIYKKKYSSIKVTESDIINVKQTISSSDNKYKDTGVKKRRRERKEINIDNELQNNKSDKSKCKKTERNIDNKKDDSKKNKITYTKRKDNSKENKDLNAKNDEIHKESDSDNFEDFDPIKLDISDFEEIDDEDIIDVL